MRTILGMTIVMLTTTIAFTDEPRPKGTDATAASPAPKKKVIKGQPVTTPIEFVTFPRLLPNGTVTFIRRNPDGSIQRVVYERLHKTDKVRITPSKATEADVRAEPKSTEPLKNAPKKLEQFVYGFFGKEPPK